MMKVLVPIGSLDDIDILTPHKYRTEFFCGYLPQWWIDEYNNPEDLSLSLSTPINNRNSPNANISSLEELKAIVDKANEYKTDVFLVLNAKYYPEYVYGNIERYINEVVSAGIKRMIVCDVGMIGFLCKHYPEIKVSVSCLSQVTNTMAVKFFASFSNVDRIVFPRHMSSDEIAKIVTTVPHLEYEYFIFSNKCLYDDGYCRGLHEFTPICKDLYYSDFYSIDGKPVSSIEQARITFEEHKYSDWTRNEIITPKTEYCTANFACSACSLLKLNKFQNIVSVKISIRGHSVEERLRQVKMACHIIQLAENGADKKKVENAISGMYGKENLCQDGKSCMML